MNGPELKALWGALQPDWPMLLMVGTILLLVLTLLAFLVAAVLLRRRNARKARQWDGYERDWGALLETAYDRGAASSEVRAAIEPGKELHFVDFLYKQALRTSDPEKRDVLTRLAMPYLPLIAARTRGGDPERRARAVKTLAELGGKFHVHALHSGLDDPSPLVSMSAARALARTTGESSVREIVSRIGRFSDWNSRFLRATLAQLGPSAGPALRENARDPALSARVRATCLEVMADVGCDGAGSGADEILRTETDIDLRAAGLRVLRRCGDRSSAPLVRSLCTDEDPVIRAQAVGTLARIGEEGDLDVVEEAMKDESPWVALHAARGLKHRGRVSFLERASSPDRPFRHGAVALQVLREEG